MEIINGIEQCRKIQDIVLALGNFDGVHRGHREILNVTVMKARETKGRSAVLVFDPHPLHLLKPKIRTQILTPLQEKAAIIEALEIDFLLVIPFDKEFASLPPEEFVKKVLIGCLQVKTVVVGFDYSFGKKGSGKSEDLKKLGQRFGFMVQVVKPVELNGKVISSSLIRNLILQGKVEEASCYLGYPYSITGTVIPGEGIGKFLGFPTANLKVSRERIIPADGVYLTKVTHNQKNYYGLTNIGYKPTFQSSTRTIETHIYNFENSIYNNELRLEFLQKIREERPFTSSKDLKEQINLDLQQALDIIKSFSSDMAKSNQT